MRKVKSSKNMVSVLVLTSLIFLCGMLWHTTPPVSAEDRKPTLPESPIKVALSSDEKDIAPGKPFKVFVDFDMQPGWHIYYKEPGQTGLPTKIEWSLPKGFTAQELNWPQPETYKDAGIVTYGYSKRVRLASVVTPPKSLKPGESVRISATVSWLACKHSCVPGSMTLTLNLRVKSN